MSKIEQIDISKVKAGRERAEKDSKIEDKREKKLKIKMHKVVMNKGSAPSMPMMPEYECTEYKNSLPLLAVEGVSRGSAALLPVNFERLKKRFMMSPDLAYLLQANLGLFDIESDKLKLLLTFGYHISNEMMFTLSQKRVEELPSGTSGDVAPIRPPMNGAKDSQPVKTKDLSSLSSMFADQPAIEIPAS